MDVSSSRTPESAEQAIDNFLPAGTAGSNVTAAPLPTRKAGRKVKRKRVVRMSN